MKGRGFARKGRESILENKSKRTGPTHEKARILNSKVILAFEKKEDVIEERQMEDGIEEKQEL